MVHFLCSLVFMVLTMPFLQAALLGETQKSPLFGLKAPEEIAPWLEGLGSLNKQSIHSVSDFGSISQGQTDSDGELMQEAKKETWDKALLGTGDFEAIRASLVQKIKNSVEEFYLYQANSKNYVQQILAFNRDKKTKEEKNVIYRKYQESFNQQKMLKEKVFYLFSQLREIEMLGNRQISDLKSFFDPYHRNLIW